MHRLYDVVAWKSSILRMMSGILSMDSGPRCGLWSILQSAHGVWNLMYGFGPRLWPVLQSAHGIRYRAYGVGPRFVVNPPTCAWYTAPYVRSRAPDCGPSSILRMVYGIVRMDSGPGFWSVLHFAHGIRHCPYGSGARSAAPFCMALVYGGDELYNSRGGGRVGPGTSDSLAPAHRGPGPFCIRTLFRDFVMSGEL